MTGVSCECVRDEGVEGVGVGGLTQSWEAGLGDEVSCVANTGTTGEREG